MTPINEFKNLLAFLVLMTGVDVLGKSPDYILEKFNRYCDGKGRGGDYYEWGLDDSNRAIFNSYLRHWNLTEESEDADALQGS